jgi:hypothetical protein
LELIGSGSSMGQFTDTNWVLNLERILGGG